MRVQPIDQLQHEHGAALEGPELAALLRRGGFDEAQLREGLLSRAPGMQ
jgi:hypothetical protein